MKRSSLIVFALAAGYLAEVPASRGDPHSTTSQVIEQLSAIDFLPDPNQLAQILNGDMASLVDIAENATDEGVRLRAYRALGMYDDDVARAGLVAGIARYRSAQSGVELLDLMAACEAYGLNGGAAAVPTLAPFLDADSRDLRATTARALGATHAATACVPLRARQSHEPTSQVRIAIDQALAALGALCAPS